MSAGEDSIRQSIGLILRIDPGERQMLPPFGCNLRQFVFGPIDTSVATMIETEVRMALLTYEPRITVETVTVTQGDGVDDPAAVIVTVAYTIRANNRRDNYVFPYYLNEATGIPS